MEQAHKGEADLMIKSTENEHRKNILIVTDRSNYFSFLGSQLEKSRNVFYVAVREADEELLKSHNKAFISRRNIFTDLTSDNKDTILDPEELNEALSCNVQYYEFYKQGDNKEQIIEKAIRYSIELAAVIENNSIDLVIVQNDSWDYASIPLAVARKKGIKTLVFEDGFFRPDTIVLDEKGVNWNNSTPRNRDFYENLPVDEEKLQRFLTEEKTKVSIPAVKRFVWLHRFLRLLRHPGKILRIIPALKIVRQDNQYKKEPLKDYVLFPLQVHKDSQILCHSPVKDITILVNHCITALEKLNQKTGKKMTLVVKEHPKDPCLAQLKKSVRSSDIDVVFLRQADTRRLIEESSLVITINSTVGIEGMLYYRPVIILGNAFFSIDGIAYHCDDLENLDILIEKVLDNPVDKDLINKFLYYLKFHYQVDGLLNKPDETNIQPVVNRINKVLKGEDPLAV